ncbi:MAG: hypothetical protein FJY56_09925 [Betaproteobacteria bacterium]|nr:hypothetical protein [Betaproteobacteria bacterium]
MGVVATLLKAVPAAKKFEAKLTAMEAELAHLRAENARLTQELDQYLEQWETLDGPQVATLQYLAANTHGHAAEIAKSVAINVQIADSSLKFLASLRFVAPAKPAAKTTPAAKARFALAAKGERYLRSRGLA